MSTGDLYLDRNRDVWRRVHNGHLVRLTLGGYISPAIPAEKVEGECGPLRELAPIDDGRAFMEIVPGSFADYKEEAMDSQGTDTWPPLTEKQQARLDEWMVAMEKLFGIPIHRHYLSWTVESESRPGRGRDVQVMIADSDHVAFMGMDPYGNVYEAVGEVTMLHNSADEECPCEGCEAERGAEL